jgi:hypothetical protein
VEGCRGWIFQKDVAHTVCGQVVGVCTRWQHAPFSTVWHLVLRIAVVLSVQYVEREW